MVLSFVGSTRNWLKYIGRALQLLTSVHVCPLLSDLRTPPVLGSSAGGIRGPCGGGTPPRPTGNPPLGPALLHQLYARPRPPPPPGLAAAGAAGCGETPDAPAAAPRGPWVPLPATGVTAAAPGGVDSVAAPCCTGGVLSGAPTSPASTCA